MRSALESINQPAPPSLHLDLLGEELVKNLGMLEEKVVAFRAALTLKAESSCTTCGPLLQQSAQTMAEVFKLAAFEVNDVATIKMCLGSVAQPHQFRVDPETKTAAHVPSQKGKKGGCLTEVSEMLQTRRPPMEAEHYFPPPLMRTGSAV